MIILEQKMTRNARKDITRCICDFNPGIGDFICCDKCSVWQHMGCMGVHPGKIPKVYECDQCNPRPLDKQAAVQLQLTLKAEESSGDSGDEAPTTKRVNSTAKRKPAAKRSRKPSSSSQKSVEEDIGDEGGHSYRDVKENMYSPAINHRLEPRTEAQPSFELSPGSISRNHPQAGSPGSNTSQPTPLLQVVNHGPARVVITRQAIKAGQYITDYMGHFKRLSELYDEIGGMSTLFKRPLNYVLHYDMLDICVDTREYGTISRFLRKSCHPNAKVRSYLNEGKLHLGIYSLDSIPANSEITLAFNLNIDQYQFVQTCACSNVGCLVTRNNERLSKTQNTPRPHSRTESTESSMSDEEHKKHKLTREELKIQSYIQSIEKREREEQRKRTLSETLKSPAREQSELDTTSDTPTRGGKRRRKGSGRKCRKPSGNSLQQELNILKSPEHFIFDPGVPQSPKSEAASPVKVKPCPSPVKNVKEPPMSCHHVCFNGYSQDLHLRPLNVSPFSRVRRDLQLHNVLTPVKIQKDGFIVPIHGSLLSPRYSKPPAKPSYKNHKKRWLEYYLQEKQNAQQPKPPSDHPKVPDNVEESPTELMNCDDPLNDVFLPQEDCATSALSDATKTLQIDDSATPEREAPVPQEPPNLHIEMPVNDTQSSAVTTPTTPVTPVGTEKKKKVSLADYRKRLQSRTPKSDSRASETSNNLPKPMEVTEPRTSSDKENSSPAVSSTEHPIFEPISPEVSLVGKGDSKSSLLEEFTKPSLSESISLESIQPRKFRKVELSDESVKQKTDDRQVSDPPQEQIQKLYYQIKEVTAPVRHDPGTAFVNGSSSIPASDKPFSRESSPGTIDDATICKIKEILYNSNPSLKVNSMSRSGSPSPKIKATRCLEQNPEERAFSSNRGLSDPSLTDNLLRSCIDESRLRFGFGENQKEVKSLHSSEGVQHEYSNTYNRWDAR